MSSKTEPESYTRQADTLRKQLALSDVQMETIEAEAREIFERETADWD